MAYLRLSILIICTLMFAPSCLRATTSPTDIFILAGQSNMAGRGGVIIPVAKGNNRDFLWDKVIPPTSNPDPSILRLNPKDQWEVAREPLCEGIDLPKKPCGIGPGMSFAKRLLESFNSTNKVIGLVPCVKGGTSIKLWLKHPEGSSSFYREMIRRIKVSEAGGGKVRAFFWFQGESDKSDPGDAAKYKERLNQFLTDLRNDFKPRNLPIVLVKIASVTEDQLQNIELVRNAISEVSEQLELVETVDARNLVTMNFEGFNPDHMHLNTTEQIKLGQWLAESYLSNYVNLAV